jgi:PGF-pre-PGF domain-containing protein
MNATSVVYLSFNSKKNLGKTTATIKMLKEKTALVSELPADENLQVL